MPKVWSFFVLDNMKYRSLYLIGIAVLAIIFLLLMGLYYYLNLITDRPSIRLSSTVQPELAQSETQNKSPETKTISLSAPIDNPSNRVTKKPFGIYITPQNSPIQPERFSGFHTGADFETTADEKNIDVPVYAITDGKILSKQWASGYGGVLVESANMDNHPVTIIYGHLNLSTINKKVGDDIKSGEQIGYLGQGYSQQTDGERKHLHLGIHKGTELNILGYVKTSSQLDQWLNPCLYNICN
jgi:murein DD-endopeptidase MepM/ murein hydrolase activator NlpD